MKVLFINGSPHQEGCTYTALKIMSDILNENGVECEIFTIPLDAKACRACYACRQLKKCVMDDAVNVFLDKMEKADALVIGSPVHYASASGLVTAFMDRVFFAGGTRGIFARKPGCAIVSARRAGTTAALDQLNKYFLISQMPIISGRYWNMVHGSKPEDVFRDEEGVQNLSVLAKNLVWHLKCMENAKNSGILPPESEDIKRTDFIRS